MTAPRDETPPPVCARCGLPGNLLDLDTGSVCHPEPSQCIAGLRASLARAEAMDKPDCYVALSGRDESILRTGRTIAAATDGLPSPDAGFGWSLAAIFNNEVEQVPKTVYAEPAPKSEAEARSFVRDRAAKIAKYGPHSLSSVWGLFRCSPEDPEEKQVADYVASSQWKLRSLPDESWYTTAEVGAASPDGERA